MKPDSALLKGGRPFFVPEELGRIEYETELVVRICRLGKGIPKRFAHRYYDAVTVGIDFTARELQQQLRGKGLPWERAKAFDGSAAIGRWIDIVPDVQTDEHRLSHRLRLAVNGTVVQDGNTADMLFDIDALISYISQTFTLRTGDLLFTGTPTGVGAVHPDDHLEGWLDDEKVLEFNCK
jgi:2-keto-4-pentenoate hydratase/2-oxohepta-3-ene-1,7-dioic acid hydratase in catechol pathway